MLTAGADERRTLRRQHLGAIFQDPMTSLNPTMRIGQQTADVAGTESEAVQLLDAVGIPEAKRRLRAFPHELSGGLRQRVMIAMAIAGSPSLVIADEPTTALDVTVQAQILELLRHLCDELHTSFLLITHDLGVAAQVADRVAVLYAGRLAETGTAVDVLQQPAHPYTRGLLRSRLTLSARRDGPLPTLPGEPPDPRNHPPGCAFAPRCWLANELCDADLPDLAPAGRHAGRAACHRLGRDEPLSNNVTVAWLPSRSSEPTRAVGLTGVEKKFRIRHGFRSHEWLQALRGVDLFVDEGESLAIVGESGCGKSTLLRTVAGLLAPDAGKVEIGRGGRPQMVFQDAGASLTPWMTVGQLVGERLHSEGVRGSKRAPQRGCQRIKTGRANRRCIGARRAAKGGRWREGRPALRGPTPAGGAGPSNHRSPRGPSL
jgi:peptide/nickel transport system ATP-binding protein